MKSTWIARGLKALMIGMIAITLFGQAVLHLWNFLMPAIFGLQPIGFWQALGLMALSWILFGGGVFRGRPMHWRHRMAERWEHMPPGEREKFRQNLGRRCGRGQEPDATQTV